MSPPDNPSQTVPQTARMKASVTSTFVEQKACEIGLKLRGPVALGVGLAALMVIFIGAWDVFGHGHLAHSNIKFTKVQLVKVDSKIQEYYAFQSPSVMPDSLWDLVEPPGGEPLYLKERDRRDAWGQLILFQRDKRRYTLRSAGPNGIHGDGDDIVHEGGR